MTDLHLGESSGVSRRTVVRGAAWSVPVVSVAATAPAFAVSPTTCPTVPLARDWSTTKIVSGTAAPKTESFAWDTTSGLWTIYQDNNVRSGTPLVFESSSPAFAVVPGSTNNGTLSFYWGYGNGRADQSARGTFQILLNGTTEIANISRPGTPLTTTSRAVTFKAPVGATTVFLTYRYTLDAQGSFPVSDDIQVSRPSFGACTVN